MLCDSSGQLLLLDLPSLVATPVVTALSLAPGPACLAYLPHPARGEQPAGPAGSEQEDHHVGRPAGLLFVGSSGGVLLEVPAAALAGGPAAALASWQAASGISEPFGSCLAPVAFGQLVPDPSGCGDARLLAGCGDAPFGRLALCRLAADVTPLAVGSADLPVRRPGTQLVLCSWMQLLCCCGAIEVVWLLLLDPHRCRARCGCSASGPPPLLHATVTCC